MNNPEVTLVQLERQIEAGRLEISQFEIRVLLEKLSDPIHCVRLGKVSEAAGYTADAILSYRRALRLDGASGQAHSALGLLELRNGRTVVAIEHFRQSLEPDPDNVARLTLLAVAYMDAGETKETEVLLRRALSVDAEYEEARYNLGLVLRETDPDEAKMQFERALEIDSEYAAAHRELGWLLSESKPNAEAEYHLRRAIELDPLDAWAHIYLGNLLWAAGNVEDAKYEYREAAAAEPNSSFPLWSLANVFEADEDWEQARTMYEQALAIDPNDVVTLMNFGRMYSRKGDLILARLLLKRALELDPNYEAARLILEKIGSA